MSIIIKDGTSESQLLKAIHEYEALAETSVLSVEVYPNHLYTLVEFDGYSVGKWIGNVDEFINDGKISQMSIIEVM